MDKIKNSLNNKKFVFWEEIARDGAQAKTILSAKERIDIARRHSQIFRGYGLYHLVFAAGFISIHEQERKIIKEVAEGIDTCYVAVNCRSKKQEIKQAYDAVKNCKYPRIAIVLPASERLCNLMLHKTVDQVFEYGFDMFKYAKDLAGEIPVDAQLAAAFDGEPHKIAEFASKLCEIDVATIGLGDTRGRIYPYEIDNFFELLLANSDDKVNYAPHLHNDLGFAIENTFVALRRGITFACSSWLGLAERNGLARTELLLFLLVYQKEKLKKRLGFDGENLFYRDPDLKLLKPIADLVSKYTGQTLSVTDPIVGLGVNSISTGTPFVDTKSFQPFDPLEILGIEKKVLVTQLASKRVIIEAGKRMGYEFDDDKISIILDIVKRKCYAENKSVVEKEFLEKLFVKFGKKINETP